MNYEQLTWLDVIAGLEGNGTRPSHKGSGVNDGKISFTLNATEQHSIALAEVHAPLSAIDGNGGCHSQMLKNPTENFVFGICSKDSNAMKSDNPKSGIYKADTSRTIDLNGGNPGCNQGGMAVVETVDVRISSTGTMNQRAHAYETEIARCLSTGGDDPDSNQGGVAIIECADVVGSLMASDYKFPQQQQIAGNKCVIEVMDELNNAAQHQQDVHEEDAAHSLTGTKTVMRREDPMEFENNQFGSYRECDQGGTLKANGADFPGGETLHESNYLVRRLTPIECERLQGMPDMWCYGVEEDELTDEELDFWIDAFETHRKIITNAKKTKTEKQIRAALKKPINDSGIYKIQGNGLALPNALFTLRGIAENGRENVK